MAKKPSKARGSAKRANAVSVPRDFFDEIESIGGGQDALLRALSATKAINSECQRLYDAIEKDTKDRQYDALLAFGNARDEITAIRLLVIRGADVPLAAELLTNLDLFIDAAGYMAEADDELADGLKQRCLEIAESLDCCESELMNRLILDEGKTNRRRLGIDSEPPAASAAAIYLGNGRIQLGAQTIALTDAQADVVQALVELRAATERDFITRSGRLSAARIIREVVRKYPILAPFITLPGARGNGGYRTTISAS